MDNLETLTCGVCAGEWQRPRVRGNKPTRCPGCRSAGTPATPRAPATQVQPQLPHVEPVGGFLARLVKTNSLQVTTPREWWEVKCGSLPMHTFRTFQDAQDYREDQQAQELPLCDGGARWYIVHCVEVA